MPKPGKKDTEASKQDLETTLDNFTEDLIKQLNKESNDVVAFNLGTSNAPTNVKRWIGTGSRLLDYAVSDRRNGGLPEGRIVEIQGPPSCHAVGEKVLKADGTLEFVEKIRLGDHLVGPDGLPRKVLKLLLGKETIYKVTTEQGDVYRFTSKHKLVLKHRFKDETLEIEIVDWLKKDEEFRACYEWCKNMSPVSFEPSATLPSIEPEEAYELGQVDAENYQVDNLAVRHFLLEEEKEFAMPKAVLLGPIEVREMYLAGLLDFNEHSYSPYERAYVLELNPYNKVFNEDLKFLCASLGFSCLFISPDKGRIFSKAYIRGAISSLPTKSKSTHVVNVFNNDFGHHYCGFTVEKEEKPDRFAGFLVNGDNKYLSDKFSILHNCGKSHLGFEIAKRTQQMGGIVLYIDTENATSVDNLKALGVNVGKRFIFSQTSCTEEVFKIAESTILKAHDMKADVPVTIIWDSVAASAPKAELEGDYDTNSIGLQARVLSKGMRKIANLIGNKNILFVLMNQQRMKIGVLYGSPLTTPGGMAIPYAASVRIQIKGTTPILDKDKNAIGVKAVAKTIKNKVARPFREAEFKIIFGKGVDDDEEIFDVLRLHCSQKGNENGIRVGNKLVSVSGTGAWKSFIVSDAETGDIEEEVKFYKTEFREKVLGVEKYEEYIAALLDDALITRAGRDTLNQSELDSDSYEEVVAASIED